MKKTKFRRLVRVVIRSPTPDPLWEKVFQWIYDQEHIDSLTSLETTRVLKIKFE